jgi:hypothetical protein
VHMAIQNGSTSQAVSFEGPRQACQGAGRKVRHPEADDSHDESESGGGEDAADG